MNFARTAFVAAVALAGIAAIGVADAQTPAPPAAATQTPAATASKPSTAKQVETWTKKQWTAAQKEWAEDKAKWADCRKQSGKKNLEGRKSWSFLYECMTG